jgi:hypothetical protein
MSKLLEEISTVVIEFHIILYYAPFQVVRRNIRVRAMPKYCKGKGQAK